jgi:NADPH:quinone reductase-like Zn-dependent oxidoreductase
MIIKVMACPVKLSDEYSALGNFGTTPYEPYVCGFEGAGVITEVGEEYQRKYLLHLRLLEVKIKLICGVSMLVFFIVLVYSLKILRIAKNYVNSLSTLLALVNHAKELKAKTVVSTAAMSSLAKSLLRVCTHEGIDVIGVIRKEADLKTLLDLGAKYALNMESPDFEK